MRTGRPDIYDVKYRNVMASGKHYLCRLLQQTDSKMKLDGYVLVADELMQVGHIETVVCKIQCRNMTGTAGMSQARARENITLYTDLKGGY